MDGALVTTCCVYLCFYAIVSSNMGGSFNLHEQDSLNAPTCSIYGHFYIFLVATK